MKYVWIFETLDVTPIILALTKKNHLGAPEELNYRAMIYSLFIRIVERMPFIKELVTRLRTSEEFSHHCRFTGSDATPSESANSRHIHKLEEMTVPEPAKPKKRGRKKKEEREQWLLDQAEIEANTAVFEKTLEQLLPLTHDKIEKETPLDPTWCTKKNTDKKRSFGTGIQGILL